MKSQPPPKAHASKRDPRARPVPSRQVKHESAWARFRALLAQPMNGASFALFRISVGIVMALEAWSLTGPDAAAISSGRSPLETYYTGSEITFHFPFELFSWLPLFPPQWIRAIVLVQAVAGVLMAIGLFYRAAAAAVFLSWGYLWVVESTRTYWQSHYYLETLLTFLMIWMPAARRYSVDAWLARNRGLPKTVPFWTLFLLRGQLLIAYFYAGVAKLNPDWLLDAMPVRWFIAQPGVTAPYARFLGPGQIQSFQALLHTPRVAYFLSYSGLIFDLAIGFLLLARRTRIFGIVLMVIFHAMNHLLIFDDIGWFPLVGILTALIFLDPDWPERLWAWLRRPRISTPDRNWLAGGAIAFPIVGAALGWKLRPTPLPSTPAAPHRVARMVAPFIVVWLLWQTWMPLRHYFIEGDGRFTYEGLSLSWRLKSETRRAYAVDLFVLDPKIISDGNIDWNEWHGDKAIYRTVAPGRINWQALPEIVAIVEPAIGERVIYNPYAAGVRTEAEARQRAEQLWSDLYGHPPKSLRSIEPFAFAGERSRGAPFLVIDDPAITGELTKDLPRIARDKWQKGPATRAPNRPNRNVGAEPLVIHLASMGPEYRNLLPRACVLDSQDPRQPPSIYWNTVSDLPVSKVMHISYQAFYLRRYARRIGDLWQQDYGRRAVVHASTAVSLNGRPHQALVDPNADLASVPVHWFSHNPWIRQLETPRIPRESLEHPPVL